MRASRLLFLIGFPFVTSAAAPAPAWHVDAAIAPAALRSPAATQSLRVSIDAQVLRQADTIDLALPGGVVHRMRVTGREGEGAGDMTVRGTLSEPSHTVTLTLHDGLVAGLISAPEAVYEVVPLADGGQAVTLLDPDAFPPCAGGIPADAPGPQERAVPAVAADPSDQVDVLVFYSPQALAAAGGVRQIRTTARAAVANANSAFANSDMVTRFRLLRVLPVERDEGSGDLGWLKANAAVVAKRNELGADLVAMLVESSLDGCGVGSVMRSPGPGFAASAFQVTKRSCAVGNLSYAHEHGHNMGMEHNPEDGTSTANASYPWSFGHYVNGNFRTVMSYNCASNCPRRPYFSNPDVNFNGLPTGIADQRDNHRTGNLVASIVANFRARQVLFADEFE